MNVSRQAIIEAIDETYIYIIYDNFEREKIKCDTKMYKVNNVVNISKKDNKTTIEKKAYKDEDLYCEIKELENEVFKSFKSKK